MADGWALADVGAMGGGTVGAGWGFAEAAARGPVALGTAVLAAGAGTDTLDEEPSSAPPNVTNAVSGAETGLASAP